MIGRTKDTKYKYLVRTIINPCSTSAWSNRHRGICFSNISEMDRDREKSVMFQEFFNPHVLLMEMLSYHWECLWHIDNMTSYDVIWFDNAVKLGKTTISQHKDRIERQIEHCLLCIHMPEIHLSHFQFQQYCIFQDGGQYGRQIIQEEISQHTDMI